MDKLKAYAPIISNKQMESTKKDEIQEELQKMVEAFAPETALMNSSTRLMVDLAWNLIRNPKKSCLKCQGLKYLSESCPRRCKWCLGISFLQTFCFYCGKLPGEHDSSQSHALCVTAGDK